MARVNRGRWSAQSGADGKVLFLIGMRINQLWKIWAWMPVFFAMPRMLLELRRRPELGLVGKPITLLSGRMFVVWQYWDSFDKLNAYARSSESEHLPAWRAFNRRIRDNGSVGIFHETVELADSRVETVYGNMPTMGLAAVTGAVPARERGQTSGQRMKGTDDTPAVEPY